MVKTRAQKANESSGDQPVSPAQMLPLNTARGRGRPRGRKPATTNTARAPTPPPTSESEPDQEVQPTQLEEHSRTQSPENEAQDVEPEAQPEMPVTKEPVEPVEPSTSEITKSSSTPPTLPTVASPRQRVNWDPLVPSLQPPAVMRGDQQALVMVWANTSLDNLSQRVPRNGPTLSVAIPMGHLGEYLKSLAAQYPGGSSPKKLTSSAGTQTSLTTGSKRKATDDLGSVRSKRNVRFAQNPAAETHKRRIVGYEIPLYTEAGKLDLTLARKPIYADDRDADIVNQVVQDDRPELQKATDSQSASQTPKVDAAHEADVAPEQIPETPSRSRWNPLSSIFNTASKILPGLGRRAAPATPTIQRPLTLTTPAASTPDVLRPRHPRSEPRVNTRPVASQATPGTSLVEAPATERPHHPRRRGKPQQTARSHKVSKTQIVSARENRQAQRLHDQAQRLHDQAEAAMSEHQNREAELSRIKEEKRILEDMEKSIETEITREKSEAQQQALEDWYEERIANPELKRKRPKSPDVIPAPQGAKFGIDLRYLVDYSDPEDEEDGEHESTSPASPTPKHRRISPRLTNPKPRMSTSKDVRAAMGTKTKAQPYTGSFFGEEAAKHQQDLNVFGEATTTKEAAQKAAEFKQSVAATAKAPKRPESPPRTADGLIITNLNGHFACPEADTDDEDSELSDRASPNADKTTDNVSQQPDKPTADPIADPETFDASSPTQRPFTTAEKGKASAWSQPPPAPPSPSHATLPSLPTTDSEMLVAARAKALKHAPKKPSHLRESSRVNSSPLAPTEVTAGHPDAPVIHSDTPDIHSDDPTVTSPSARRPPQDEVINKMWQDIVSKPNAKLRKALEVLAEKSPNSQSKSPSKASDGKAHAENAATGLTELAKTFAKPAAAGRNIPERDETPVEGYLGFPGPVPKWMVDFVEKSWTEKNENDVDLTADLAAFGQKHPDLYEEEGDDPLEGLFPEESIEELANMEVANFMIWNAEREAAKANLALA